MLILDHATFGNIYNLGYAHGHLRQNFTDFKASLLDKASKSKNKVLICHTNEVQEIERNYLRDLGFEERKMTSQLITHYITTEKLLKENTI